MAFLSCCWGLLSFQNLTCCQEKLYESLFLYCLYGLREIRPSPHGRSILRRDWTEEISVVASDLFVPFFWVRRRVGVVEGPRYAGSIRAFSYQHEICFIYMRNLSWRVLVGWIQIYGPASCQTRVIVTKIHVRSQGLALYPSLKSRDFLELLRVMMVEAALSASEHLEP